MDMFELYKDVFSQSREEMATGALQTPTITKHVFYKWVFQLIQVRQP